MESPLSESLPGDIIDFILGGLNMFDLVKVGHINTFYYEKSEQNQYWEKIYEKMFNRTFIDKNSIHEGDVTWWNCKVGMYPGWSHVHRPIDNCGNKCRIRSHYSCLSEKKPKIKYKNYKKMVMKRYRTLVIGDPKIKTNSQDYSQLRYWEKRKEIAEINIKNLSKKITNESHIHELFAISEKTYKEQTIQKKTSKKQSNTSNETHLV